MFIGHLAVGYALKRKVPKASLGTLIAAPLFLDLLWPFMLLAGVESVRIDPGNTVVTPFDLHDFPWTHSLAMALVWSVLFGSAYAWGFTVPRGARGWRTGHRAGGSWLGLGVFSHWILDWISHRPDLPLYPGSETYVGLGLWNSLTGTLAVEFALYAIGIWAYASVTRPKDRTGTYAWWITAAFFGLAYLGNVFGPPPPSARAIAVAGCFIPLFIPLFAWVDRHRKARRVS